MGSVGDVVSVGDEVEVRVLSVDAATGKIALTMKGGGEQGATGWEQTDGLFGGTGVIGDAATGRIALIVKGVGEHGGLRLGMEGLLAARQGCGVALVPPPPARLPRR